MKEKLFELLQHAYGDQHALIDDLSDAERSAMGVCEHWSFKDVVAHVTAWNRRAIERIDALRRGEEPPRFDDIDQINDATFEALRDRSWAEVIADADRVYHDLVQRVDELSHDDVTNPDRFPHQNGRSLVRLITGDGFSHPELHYAQFRAERGELTRATQMQVAATEALEGLSEWRNVARYNLACFYALTGQTEQAVAALRESFKINPDLIKWSKQDTDLVSLRRDPGFQALYST